MAVHCFDTEVARRYGMSAAVLLYNISFWIAKNTADGKHFHDGRYWTYSSSKALSELFPYLSESTIKRSIKKLEDDGILISGNFNKQAYDRTKWYAMTDKGYALISSYEPEPTSQNDNMQLPFSENPSCQNEPIDGSKMNQWIEPDRATNTIYNPYINTDINNTDTLKENTSSHTNVFEDVSEKETEPSKKKRDKVPYQKIVDQFNEICTSFPEVTSLSEGRKAAIRSRYKEYGEDKIIDVFRRAEASDFLSGRKEVKDSTWKCGFDWLMRPSNFLKVIEGNYDDGVKPNGQSNSSGNGAKKIPKLSSATYL